MSDDDKLDAVLVKHAARGMIQVHGKQAASVAREHAKYADSIGDERAAETWREIDDEIGRLQKQP